MKPLQIYEIFCSLSSPYLKFTRCLFVQLYTAGRKHLEWDSFFFSFPFLFIYLFFVVSIQTEAIERYIPVKQWAHRNEIKPCSVPITRVFFLFFSNGLLFLRISRDGSWKAIYRNKSHKHWIQIFGFPRSTIVSGDYNFQSIFFFKPLISSCTMRGDPSKVVSWWPDNRSLLLWFTVCRNENWPLQNTRQRFWGSENLCGGQTRFAHNENKVAKIKNKKKHFRSFQIPLVVVLDMSSKQRISIYLPR